MKAKAEFVDLHAALSMRANVSAIRVLIMAVIAVMLWTLGDWSLAPYWWAAYTTLQWALVRLNRPQSETTAPVVYAIAMLSYAVAGFPAWHMWSHMGVMGIAAATMFLAGMLAQLVVSSLGTGRLFWASATPLTAYLIAIPPLTFGSARLTEGLAVSACAILMMSYLAVLRVGQQRTLKLLRESQVKAVAASQAKTDFLAAMSHELRTPMNAVLGAVELLGRTDLNEEQRGHLAMLADGGKILMHVLNDVLDLAKIEAGKLLIDPATADLHDLVRRCAAVWGSRADDKGLDLELIISPQAPQYVVIDALRIGQIVFNLVSNSLKFTETGRVTLRLDVEEVSAERTLLRFQVSDTGIGMSADTLSSLFSAFQQADGSISRRFGGTGLGLSISQKLAEMMGGTISAESVEGKGSTFTVSLPVEVATLHEADAVQPVEMTAELRPGLRILVAEDNPSNQRIIDYFLRPIEADVTIVGDGQQALEALSISPFDLVLMDLQMPVMDGLEATRRLRASGGVNAQIPVLALTANVMEAQRQACFDAGMTGHIAKPIDARLLLTSVFNAFDSSERPRLTGVAATGLPPKASIAGGI